MTTATAATGRVLIVDDDLVVRDVVRRYLERDGHEVALAADGEVALATVERAVPDVVVLDVLLPGVDGLEVCRRLRERSGVPVLLLTALGEEADRIAGLELGADDYVTKPFSPAELALRVAAVLRRARAVPDAPAGVLVDGGLVVDIGRRTVVRDGAQLALTGREFDLLVHLLRHPARAFTRAELLERVWGWSFGDAATVTVHVRRLREKVETDPVRPARIVTVRGVGYRYDGAGPC